MTENSLVSELLDAIEAREDPLLSWGVVDGGLSPDELRQLVFDWGIANAPLADVDSLINDLTARGLVYFDDAVEPPRWRSRIAETLRLLARLRQIFPTQNPAESWRRGTPLVADFRYLRRPRSFPARNQDWTAALDGIADVDDSFARALQKLTATSDGSMDLAGFQVRATREVLAALTSQTSRGVVVGAGTGSGKTLSFYLPAYTFLASIRDASTWTRALAIYPRTELLRDQFTSAFRSARRADKLFIEETGRKMRIGAFYGAAPTSVKSLDTRYSQWSKTQHGYLCPYLGCPGNDGNGCGGELYWPDDAVKRGEELLSCIECSAEFGEDTIVITRQRMKAVAPDIVFTTTEMLNRTMLDLASCSIIGIGLPESKRPRMVLLDEIHTYGGASGAQTAMLLRRWRNRINTPVTFVGLSATLVEAGNYFATLAGISAEHVVSVEPSDEEMVSEGAEYLIAARTDPTSTASVLSTTIQSTMLVARILDTPGSRTSANAYGSKVFVFTDDLDVTNRLFYDTLDAEGLRLGKGLRVAPGNKPPLAALRNPALGGGVARRLAGQSWDLPRQLGHPIDQNGRLRVGRTSSQDSGVDAEAQAVIATASLEVGFDDPQVGAVIQHKAPRDVAQFVQRMGRAGRVREMRPITLVVLSDYGRDRAAYEGWDVLFDPVLPARTLPVRNRAVLRMHAAQSLLEWVALKVRHTHPDANLWQSLKGPATGEYHDKNLKFQNKVIEVLENLLADPVAQTDLTRWLQSSLGLNATEINEILWHPPRPVLMGAVPTLIRRLRSRFAVASGSTIVEGLDSVSDHPLPDYFPGNLFSELTMSEVSVVVPSQTADPADTSIEPMGVAQMMREYAPGRVSRRFATKNALQRHWIPVNTGADQDFQDVANFVSDFDIAANPKIIHRGHLATYDLIRPHRLELAIAPDDVTDSSNAQLTWRTEFVEQGSGTAVRLPATDRVGRLIHSMSFFLHAQSSWIRANRVAVESDATVQFEDGTERRTRTQFLHQGAPAGIGVSLDVDALKMDVVLPETSASAIDNDPGLRSAWFQHVIVNDEALLNFANSFQLIWLQESIETMLVIRSVEGKTSLEDAYNLISGSLTSHLRPTLEAIFQRPQLDFGTAAANAQPTRLLQRLTALLDIPAVSSRLDELIPELWRSPSDEMLEWLRARLLTTIGQAAYSAARALCPDHDPEGLLVDVEPGLKADGLPRRGEVWLSEPNVGGGGFIEALARRIQADPRRFLRLMWSAIQPATAERVSQQLDTVVDRLGKDAQLMEAVARYRSSENQNERSANLRNVRIAVAGLHLAGDEQMLVGNLANRILRPNTSSTTDSTIRALIAGRKEAEERLGIEISTRTWAFLASATSSYDLALDIAASSPDAQLRRIDVIMSLLWPTGWRLRADALSSWNPFMSLPFAIPELLRTLLPEDSPLVSIEESEVEERLRELLADHQQVRLEVPGVDIARASALIVKLASDPVESEWMFLHPSVVEVERKSDGTAILTFATSEGSQ